MTDTNKFLLRSLEENWIHARQSENKRATLANVAIVVVAAIHIALTQTGFNTKALPLTILLIFLGIYGIMANVKLYERQQFHTLRARKLRARLDELCPHAHVQQLQIIAEDEHKIKNAKLMNFRLNNIWLGLHALIATAGIIYTIISLFPKGQ